MAYLAAKQRRVKRRGQPATFTAYAWVGRFTTIDGDKSPAESGDESPHSKGFVQAALAWVKEHLKQVRLCGWEGHDANRWRQLDAQVFGLYGFAKADAQTTLPTAKVPANTTNIELLREAYHSV